MKKAITLFALSTMALVACAPEGGAPEGGEPDARDEAPVEITEVRTTPDGTQQVLTASWSRAEMREAVRERERLAAGAAQGEAAGEGGERVGEAAQPIYVDRLCSSPTALWITDNGSYNDINHMICFEDPGFIAMPSPWVGAFWGGAHTPVAFYSGGRSGRIWYASSSCDAGCSVPFPAWTQQSLQTFPGPNARYDAVSLD